MAALTLDYWIEDGWYVGKLREVLGIFSQAETLEDLEVNIRDALDLMLEEEAPRARLDAVRAALAGHEDQPVEQLVRQQRDERTRKLAGPAGVARQSPAQHPKSGESPPHS